MVFSNNQTEWINNNQLDIDSSNFRNLKNSLTYDDKLSAYEKSQLFCCLAKLYSLPVSVEFKKYYDSYFYDLIILMDNRESIIKRFKTNGRLSGPVLLPKINSYLSVSLGLTGEVLEYIKEGAKNSVD